MDAYVNPCVCGYRIQLLCILCGAGVCVEDLSVKTEELSVEGVTSRGKAAAGTQRQHFQI